MPNQNQWSVFKASLDLSQALQILDLSSFSLPLVHNGYQEYYSPCGLYFIDHYLHDMNQAASLILIGYYGLYLLQTLVQYLGNLFFCACVLQYCQGYSQRCLCQYGETGYVLL